MATEYEYETEYGKVDGSKQECLKTVSSQVQPFESRVMGGVN